LPEFFNATAAGLEDGRRSVNRARAPRHRCRLTHEDASASGRQGFERVKNRPENIQAPPVDGHRMPECEIRPHRDQGKSTSKANTQPPDCAEPSKHLSLEEHSYLMMKAKELLCRRTLKIRAAVPAAPARSPMMRALGPPT